MKVNVRKLNKESDAIQRIVNSHLYNLKGFQESIILMNSLHKEYNVEFPTNENRSKVNLLFSNYNQICLYFISNHSQMNDENINNFIDSMDAIRYSLLKLTPKGSTKIISENNKNYNKNFHNRINFAVDKVMAHRTINEITQKYISRFVGYISTLVLLFYAFVTISTKLQATNHTSAIIIFNFVMILIMFFLVVKSVFAFYKVKTYNTIRKRTDLNNKLTLFGVYLSALAALFSVITLLTQNIE